MKSWAWDGEEIWNLSNALHFRTFILFCFPVHEVGTRLLARLTTDPAALLSNYLQICRAAALFCLRGLLLRLDCRTVVWPLFQLSSGTRGSALAFLQPRIVLDHLDSPCEASCSVVGSGTAKLGLAGPLCAGVTGVQTVAPGSCTIIGL